MTEREQGFQEGIEAAAKACDEIGAAYDYVIGRTKDGRGDVIEIRSVASHIRALTPPEPQPGPVTWPESYESCPKCRDSFSFNRPQSAADPCPWCGFHPEPVTPPAPRPVVDTLRELMAKATPGKWESRHRDHDDYDRREVVRLPSGQPDDGGDIVCRTWSSVDADLIAAIHEALPLLLAVTDAAQLGLEDIDRALNHFDAPKTGMRVPYHGPFAAATPSVVWDLRQIAKRLGDALRKAAK